MTSIPPLPPLPPLPIIGKPLQDVGSAASTVEQSILGAAGAGPAAMVKSATSTGWSTGLIVRGVMIVGGLAMVILGFSRFDSVKRVVVAAGSAAAKGAAVVA